MKGSLLSWRNWVWDSTLVSTDDFESDAPLEYLKTPQIGEIARTVDDTGPSVTATFPDPVPVQLIAILNHNLPSGSNITITLKNAADTTIGTLFDPDIWIPPESGFIRNLYIILPAAVSSVKSVDIVSLWPNSYPWQAGGLWIGPLFNREFDADWQLRPSERPHKITSDGNQTRTSPNTRFRELQFRISRMSEAEAMGIDSSGGRTAIPHQNILDMAVYSCLSRPVIAIPRLSSAERIHKTGVYGYFNDPIAVYPQAGQEPDAHPNNYAMSMATMVESV